MSEASLQPFSDALKVMKQKMAAKEDLKNFATKADVAKVFLIKATVQD